MNDLNQNLQTKFPHLEVNIVNFQKIKRHHILGSEFNSNTRENMLQILKSNHKVGDYFDLISSTISFIKEPVYIYDLTHSLSNFLEDVDLTQENLNSNKKEVIENDFIISRLRSYLKEMAVVQPKNYRQLVSTEYLIYRSKTKLLSPNTLMIFCLSSYVQTILNYSQYGTEHPRFYEFIINEMPIPKVIFELNFEIDSMMIQAYKFLEQSKGLYKEAQNMLYIELGLNPDNPLQSILDFHPTPKEQDSKLTQKSLKQNLNISIRTLKESLGTSGRLDSEYYQSKYDKIESYIKNYKEGFNKLELIEIKDSNFTPKAKEKYRYIELANIGANGSISAPLEEFGKDLPTRARRIVKEGDLIVSSIEGSLSSCALITQEFDDCIVSTGFYILKSLHINSETLLVLFKSQVFQEYLKKFPSGTILTAISKDELQNILIPKIDFKTQEEIATLIQESFALRAKAKALLEEAKIKVETKIKDASLK